MSSGQPWLRSTLYESSCWQTEGASPDRTTNRLTPAGILSKIDKLDPSLAQPLLHEGTGKFTPHRG